MKSLYSAVGPQLLPKETSIRLEGGRATQWSLQTQPQVSWHAVNRGRPGWQERGRADPRFPF